MTDYKLTRVGVIRESDGANVPSSLANKDWRKYQDWLRLGNTPDPMDVVVKPPIADKVESRITNDPTWAALARWIAKDKGITEREVIDEIRAEAKEVVRQ